MTPIKCFQCKYLIQDVDLTYCDYDGDCCPYVKGGKLDENDDEASDKRETTHEDL